MPHVCMPQGEGGCLQAATQEAEVMAVVSTSPTPHHWAPPLRNCSNRPHCLLIAIATAAHELLGAGGGEACWAGRRAARGASGYRQAAQVQPHLASKVLTPCPLRAAQCPMLSLGHGCPPWA